MAIGMLIPNVLGSAAAGVAVARSAINAIQGIKTGSLFLEEGMINGFLFDYVGETRFEREVEISDHFTERNDVYNDHMGVKPMHLVMRGFAAELSQTKGDVRGLLGGISSTLTQFQGFVGGYTAGAMKKMQAAVTQGQNILGQVNQAVAIGKNVAGLFGAAGMSKQKKAFAKLSALQTQKTLFSVVTPFGVFDNMALERLVVTQPAETKDWSDFTVYLKQINIVPTTAAQARAKSAIAAAQGAAQTNGGTSPGKALTAVTRARVLASVN